jgi:hypothetical protein
VLITKGPEYAVGCLVLVASLAVACGGGRLPGYDGGGPAGAGSGDAGGVGGASGNAGGVGGASGDAGGVDASVVACTPTIGGVAGGGSGSPGTGSLTPVSASFYAGRSYLVGENPVQAAIGDLDGDGRADLAVVNSYASVARCEASITVSVLLNQGASGFAPAIDYPVFGYPTSLVIGDLDGDGKPDLAVASADYYQDNGYVSVLVNRGDGSFGAATTYPAGPMGPLSISIGDFDGDGDLDLVMAGVNGLGASVFLNNGDGTLTGPTDYQVAGAASQVAAADLNGDGNVDLVVSGSDGTSVLLNTGRGIFGAPVKVSANPPSFAVGDVNGDGKNDLVFSGTDGVSVFLNDGAGAFGLPIISASGATRDVPVLGELNGDGKIDLVLGSVALFWGDGTGAFVPSTSNYANIGHGTALGDLNGDGRIDIAAVGYGDPGIVSVLVNNGNGTFVAAPDYPLAIYGTNIGIGDLDGDGDLDLAVASGIGNDNTVSVLLNDGDGSFATAVGYPAGMGVTSVAIGDLDGDGKGDLVVAAGTGGDVFSSTVVNVLKNDGNGGFAIASSNGVGVGPGSVVIGDMNGDGKLDVVVANAGVQPGCDLCPPGTLAPGTDFGHVTVLLNDGHGVLSVADTYFAGQVPRQVGLADVNGDGWVDVIVQNVTLGVDSVGVLLNNGQGAFGGVASYPSGPWPYGGPALGDLDGDGKTDIAVGRAVLFNVGNGTFGSGVQVATALEYGFTVGIGDFNGDGNADLGLGFYAGAVGMLLGDGHGGFTADRNFFPGWIAGVADLNRDGKADLIVLTNQGVSVLLNTSH